jgi:hypothetical protein
MRMYRSIAAVVTTLAVTACTDPGGVQSSSILTAVVEGSVQGAYTGTGSFQLLPGSVEGPRFRLRSMGTGNSANQGFAFLAMEAPSPGDVPIGELDDATTHVNYWYDEGAVRNLFRADSGVLRITESTARRVAGEFEIEATLLYLCEITPGFPADFLICDTPEEEGTVLITGAFDAAPFGPSP